MIQPCCRGWRGGAGVTVTTTALQMQMEVNSDVLHSRCIVSTVDYRHSILITTAIVTIALNVPIIVVDRAVVTDGTEAFPFPAGVTRRSIGHLGRGDITRLFLS